MDAFFVAVELLDAPSLRGRPVVVGGSGRRGVVASCSYEARAFGVRSAMPMVRARQLCPSVVVLDGRHSRYAEVSRRLGDIFRGITPIVEPIGLDEAFLDVTGVLQLSGPPEEIADRIRRRVRGELSLECSIGVGRSKLIAKLASRSAKPRADVGGTRAGRGVVVVGAEDEAAFLRPLPVRALWGVGPSTAERLHQLGVRTVAELAGVPRATLERHFGRSQGGHLADLALGHDPSPVEPDRAARSIGHEETFVHDIDDRDDLRRRAAMMAEAVAAQLRSHGLVARTVTLKVRFADFASITRRRTVSAGLDTGRALSVVCHELLDSVDVTPGVRLLGVSTSGLVAPDGTQQLAFALDPADPPGSGTSDTEARAARLQQHWQGVTAALDDIRGRFGTEAVSPGVGIGPDGRPDQARRGRWGPSAASEEV